MLNALGRGTALAAVEYALQTIEPSEWQEYLFFTKELHPVPDRQQWQTIKDYRNALALVLPNQGIPAPVLNPDLALVFTLDRERYVQPDALRDLITLLAQCPGYAPAV